MPEKDDTKKEPTSVTGMGTTNLDWWPNRLKLEILHQHSSKSNPMGEDFNYAKSSRASTWRL